MGVTEENREEYKDNRTWNWGTFHKTKVSSMLRNLLESFWEYHEHFQNGKALVYSEIEP
jgi:hypothetical protein